jgi:serine/threonine protein kinase
MLLSRTNYDSTKNDIWSIGCIALELLTNYEHKNNPYHPYNQALDQEENVDSPTKLSTV